jgi:hypothetical protein
LPPATSSRARASVAPSFSRTIVLAALPPGAMATMPSTGCLPPN